MPAPARNAASTPPTVAVWDPLLRVLHWSLAASVLIAWFTANIFDKVHEIAGYAALVLAAGRVVWGFIGPP